MAESETSASSITASLPSNDGPKFIDPIDKYSALIVRGTIVGVGMIGIGLFLKNSRLFARFETVSQIPKDIIRKELELKGRVREILSTGELRIEHEPIIKLPNIFRQKSINQKGLLNIRLAGLDISKAGQQYIAKDLRLTNKPVTFTVIKPAEDLPNTIDADVTVKKNFVTRTNLNVDLVRRGYARVPAPDHIKHLKALQSVPAYSRLVSKLLMSEKVADRRGVGVWERDTWVESVQSAPSQFVGYVRAAAITKFAFLMYNLTKDVVLYGVKVAQGTWHIFLTICSYLALGYRKFGQGMSTALDSVLTDEQRENCRKNRENALRIRAEKEKERQLTDEQKQRVQENRERALRLREERWKEFGQQPSTSAHNDQAIKEPGKPLIQTVAVRPPVRNALDQAAVLRPLQLQSPKPAGIPATNLPKPKSIVTMKVFDEDTIVINHSPYHELINDALRKVPSRRYDGKIRKNVIHIKDLRMCEDLLQKLTQIDIVLESIPDDAFRVLARAPSLQPVPDDLKQAVDPDLIKFAYDYQIEGIKFGIARNGKVLIADEMGLGKSIQALGIARFFKTEWPLVIVCPAAVTTTWKDTVLRFLPYSIKIERIHLLLSKSVPMPTDRRSSTIVIMSYDQMKLREEELLKQRFQVYIFDESHQLKEMKTKKTVTAQKLCKFANHVILLSGTPALSKPAELYSQIRLIDPTLFPKFETFALRYCDGRPGAYGFEAKGCTNSEELTAILSKCVMIRRMKNNVSAKLPPKKRELIFIEDNKINLKLESLQTAKRLFERNKSSGGDIFGKNSSGESTIIDYYRETGMAKATAVTEHVMRNYFANFEAGVRPERKVLIFAHHQIVLDTFEYEMTRRGVGFVRIDGALPQAARGLQCDRFQIDDNCFVALLSITAAGVGINLTAGSIVIFAELTWTPGHLLQAEDRAHRVGQKEEVLVQYMVAKNTADDHILPLIERKMELLNLVSLNSETFANATRRHETINAANKRPLAIWLQNDTRVQPKDKREKDN